MYGYGSGATDHRRRCPVVVVLVVVTVGVDFSNYVFIVFFPKRSSFYLFEPCHLCSQCSSPSPRRSLPHSLACLLVYHTTTKSLTNLLACRQCLLNCFGGSRHVPQPCRSLRHCLSGKILVFTCGRLTNPIRFDCLMVLSLAHGQAAIAVSESTDRTAEIKENINANKKGSRKT